MATRNTKTARSTKAKKVEGVKYTINEDVILTCYDWGDNYTCKVEIIGAFVIFGTIRKSKDKGYFVSYPSYENNKGDYVSTAYCFSKTLIKEINETVTEYMNG